MSSGDDFDVPNERRRPDTWPASLARYLRPRLFEEAPSTDALLACVSVYVVLAAACQFAMRAMTDGQPSSRFFVAIVQQIGSFAGAIVVVRVMAPHFARQRLSRLSMSAVGTGMRHAVAWLPFVLGLNALLSVLIQDRTIHPALQGLQTAGVGTTVLIWISAALAAPLAEELLFRGLILPWIGERTGPWTAVLASSILFGLLHLPMWPAPIPLTVLGIGLGLCYLYSGSLWAPIALHATFNSVNLAIQMVSTAV